ncbi:MAG: type II TA system antitoxin MqsA family protein [Polyangiaceae bacterium]
MMKKISRTRRAVEFPADACPVCGTAMKEKRGRLAFPINGEDVRVPGATHLACPRGHDVVLRADDARRLREGALELYRRKYGLLSADEIHSLRERFGLTQAELARLLRLGQNTLSRWEAGRYAQTAAMDVLLRLLRDVPGGIEYLRKHAA